MIDEQKYYVLFETNYKKRIKAWKLYVLIFIIAEWALAIYLTKH